MAQLTGAALQTSQLLSREPSGGNDLELGFTEV